MNGCTFLHGTGDLAGMRHLFFHELVRLIIEFA